MLRSFTFLTLFLILFTSDLSSQVVKERFERKSKEFIVELIYAYMLDYEATDRMKQDERDGRDGYKSRFIDQLEVKEFVIDLKEISKYLDKNGYSQKGIKILRHLSNNRDSQLANEDYRIMAIPLEVDTQVIVDGVNLNKNVNWKEIIDEYSESRRGTSSQMTDETNISKKSETGDKLKNEEKLKSENLKKDKENPEAIINSPGNGNSILKALFVLLLPIGAIFAYRYYLLDRFKTILGDHHGEDKVAFYKRNSDYTDLPGIIDGLNKRKDEFKREQIAAEIKINSLKNQNQELVDSLNELKKKQKDISKKKSSGKKGYKYSSSMGEEENRPVSDSFTGQTEQDYSPPRNEGPENADTPSRYHEKSQIAKNTRYFGVPNPGGNFNIDQGSETKEGIAYYEISWLEGETQGIIKYVADARLSRRAIASLDESLKPVCEIRGIELIDSAERVTVVSEGKVYRQSNLWQIDASQKVEIQLS